MQTFEKFYVEWYARAKRFAHYYVNNENEAEDIIQDVFMNMYIHYQNTNNLNNLPGYLLSSIKNHCLDYLKKELLREKIKDNLQMEYEIRFKYESLELMDIKSFNENLIEQKLQIALNKLPEQCRKIFIMSKIEGKKQKIIAEELSISINTIESQIGIAYKKLRNELKNYFPYIILFLQ